MRAGSVAASGNLRGNKQENPMMGQQAICPSSHRCVRPKMSVKNRVHVCICYCACINEAGMSLTLNRSSAMAHQIQQCVHIHVCVPNILDSL